MTTAKRIAIGSIAVFTVACIVAISLWLAPPFRLPGPPPVGAACRENLRMLWLQTHAYKERHGTLPERLTDMPDVHPQLLRCPALEYSGRSRRPSCPGDYVYVGALLAEAGLESTLGPSRTPMAFDCMGNHDDGSVNVLMQDGSVGRMDSKQFASYLAEVVQVTGRDPEVERRIKEWSSEELPLF